MSQALLWPFRKRRERDRFISGSLTSSRAVLDRIAAFSGSNNRGRPFVLQFHKEWEHNDCPVMGWYRQQCISSTRFRSIEHRREMNAPFYHEFLLLRLKDGAICRVERMGDGLRADALRYTGCRARDLVQWLTADDYARFEATCSSELITEIDFLCDYDILDVLAICYSIQNTKGCRVYTLQRYNCYFLCLTILGVLTRRVANWSIKTTASAWDGSVSLILDRILRLAVEEPSKELFLRICALLEPENSTSIRQVLDSLSYYLSSQADVLANLNSAFRKTLWSASLESALQDGLKYTVTCIEGTLLQAAESAVLTPLQCARNTSCRDAEKEILADSVLAQHYLKELSNRISYYCTSQVETSRRLFRPAIKERNPPLRSRIVSKTCGVLAAMTVAIYPASFFITDELERLRTQRLVIQRCNIRGRFSLAKLALCFVDALVLSYVHPDERVEDISKMLLSLQEDFFLSSMADLFDSLELKGALGQSEASHLLGYWLDDLMFPKILNSFIVSQLKPLVVDRLRGQNTRIHICSGTTDTPKSVNGYIDVVKFQEDYIKPRIYAHAQRISAHHLADTTLVCEDIQKTMTEVWRSLPPGFGAT